MAEREIRYCTAEDGVRIAYCIEGEGSPVIACPHLFEAFSLEHQFPALATIRRLMAEGHRVVRYDMRGTGLSQREVNDVSHGALVRDIEAVVDATGLARFALSGSELSGARAIDYAVRYPERVERLVLWSARPRFASGVPEGQVRAFAELARTNWSVAAQAFADDDLRERQEVSASDLLGFGRLIRKSVDGEMAAKILLEMYDSSDVLGLLPHVRVPTLIIDRERNIDRARTLAANIPDSLFVLLTGNGSSFIPANARPGIEALHMFLGDNDWRWPDEHEATKEGQSVVQTVLFTDIVSSTALTQRLGDAKAQALVRVHDTIVRAALSAHGGREIKHTGDGIMASFPTASSAVECAIAIQRAVEAEGSLLVRIGLNAGEPVAEDADLFGTAVQLARRICDHAEAGQIMVSNVVRELAAGKGFLFSDTGDVALKGFEDPVRLYEVRWKDDA